MSPARLAWLAVGGSGLALVAGQPAMAQTPGEGATQPEIVVTAQRRPERPEDVPISLTALGGAELDQRLVTDTDGLERVVPSLTMIRTGAFTQPYLRGIGKRSTLGIENGVATYVDGVYFAEPISALLDLRGIERVEILNGPQGTLFGRNATGGVIQVVTREPSAETSAEVMLEAGSDGFIRGDAYLTGGSEALAGNIAVSLSAHDGYGTNLFTGRSDQGEVRRSLAARSRWVWRPAGALTIGLAADYQDLDHDFSYRPVEGYAPIGNPRVIDLRDGDQDGRGRYRFRHGGVSLRADAELGSVTFMSLSALRRVRARYGADLDLGPEALLEVQTYVRQSQFSQEFQLQSDPESPVQWTAGLYFIHLRWDYDANPFTYGGSYSARIGGRIGQNLVSTGEASSYAAYAQGTLPLGDATALTVGLRYTIEEKSVAANGERRFDNPPFLRSIPGLPLFGQPPFRNEITFDEPMWRFALDRRFSPTLMGYVSASRGFQVGGWNLQTPQNPPFTPERIDAFEAGLKYASPSRRLRAEASIFYYDYSDLQVTTAAATGAATTNAPSVEVFGAGVQLDARLGRATELSLGLQWLESRFGHFPNAACVDYTAAAASPYAQIPCDVTGNSLPYAPELKLTVAASQEIALDRAGSLLLSGNLAYSSGYFAEADNVLRQDAFATIDLSAEWRPGPAAPTVRLWLLNLTGARYYNSLTVVATAGPLQIPAPPRRFGVSIIRTF